MLELKNVTYEYQLKHRTKKVALKDISMRLEKGKFYTVFGVSGSGKTTCLSLLGGLDIPTSGKVLLDGQDVMQIGLSQLRRQYVSYIFQDYQLFTYMTAVENVMTALDISHPEMTVQDMKEKAVAVLCELGLTENEINRKVTQLSGGQMQRVAIARALAVDAQYILADEPTGNLDENNTDIIITLLRKLTDDWGKCVVVVTHSRRVQEASDVSFILDDGKIEEIKRMRVD
ncbi:MAG: ABC transporter ATP-binding protein [Lachnospiraceae bacterium]